jgi:Pectate lyase superfamily protein
MTLNKIKDTAIVWMLLLPFSVYGFAAGARLSILASAGESQSPVASPATVSSVGPPTHLVLLQQPSDTSTQAVISPPIRVAIEDVNGNIVPTATNRVRVNLTGIYGLGGALKVNARKGVAIFSDLVVDTPGNYTLTLSSPGLTSTTSAVFTVGPPVTTSNGTTIMQTTPVSIDASPGGNFQITYSWQAVPVEGQAFVFVDFVDSTGTVRFQDNVQPPIPASQWTGPVSYTHTVTVPLATAPGNYEIVAGINSSIGNISLVAGPGVTPAVNGGYQVGSLILVPTCPITSFGAVGDGVTNNSAAMQNTFNYAAANKCTAVIPAGTFAYSGTLTARGIAVTGTGASSILKALDPNNEALTMTGNAGSISNLVMQGTGTTRNVTYQAAMIWVNGATNFSVQNVLINGGSCVGIFDAGGQGGLIQRNTVENTLADSITNTNGASNIAVKGNHVLNSGDDGISNNSYLNDSNTVHDITVSGNTIVHNKWGRGIEVSGGSNITFSGNYVDNLDGYSDMYIASEREWNTQSVSNITVTGNTFVDGGPNQGTAIIYNSEAGANTIAGVTISGNQFVNPKAGAVQFAGAGAETGLLVQNNIDFSTRAFSFSSNATAQPTQSGNQVSDPSTYTAPLVAPGGGCSFSGC